MDEQDDKRLLGVFYHAFLFFFSLVIFFKRPKTKEDKDMFLSVTLPSFTDKKKKERSFIKSASRKDS